MRRPAFTLVEMTLATAVTAVLSVALATLFVGIHRLVRQSYADAALSLSLRAERERALFNAVTEGGSVYWGGLLSAKGVSLSGGDAVAFTAIGVQTESGASLSRRGQRRSAAAVGNEQRTDEGDLSLFAFTAEKTVADETRTARAVVPVFGVKQGTDALNVFGEEDE